MSERQIISFPETGIRPAINPRSEKERILFQQGARILDVDITPPSLQGVEEFVNHPLLLTVVELLPVMNWQVIEPHWKPGRQFDFRQRYTPGPAGILVNTGTHLDEPTSAAFGDAMRNSLAEISTRPSYNVFISGFGEASADLTEYLVRNGLVTGSGPGVDTNRKFISPHPDTEPKDPYEEMAQAYLRFAVSRYRPFQLLILDGHSESTETEVTPHGILGRTVRSEEKERLYSQARALFPHLSIVWDLKQPEYSDGFFDQSFADALVKFGFGFGMTLEVASGKGGIHHDHKYFAMLATLEAMLNANLLEWDIGNAAYQKVLGQLSWQYFLKTANDLLGNVQLRREWAEVQIPFSGIFQALPGITEKRLTKYDTIGLFTSSSGVIRDVPIRIPRGVEECVLLGIPDDGLYNQRQNPDMYLSLALPE